MFTIRELARPASLEDAYGTLLAGSDNTLLAGCGYLRLGNKKIATGIDMSGLKLDYVTETTDMIEIGAMTSLRKLETHPVLRSHFCGVLSRSVEHIIGVQFRSLVTIGAPLFSRYGFSDPLTALLALDASVHLHKAGWLPLGDFLRRPFERDILTAVRISKDGRMAAFQGFRNAATDYSLLNAAVASLHGRWTIAVGARPMAAQRAERAAEALAAGATPETAGSIAATELSFGANFRASAEYRKALCGTLVARAVREVMQCKSN